jgi:hypothetical protein
MCRGGERCSTPRGRARPAACGTGGSDHPGLSSLDTPKDLDHADSRAGGKDEAVCGAVDKPGALELVKGILDRDAVAELSAEIVKHP